MRFRRDRCVLALAAAVALSIGLSAEAQTTTPAQWGSHYAYGDRIHDVGFRVRLPLTPLQGVPGSPEFFIEAGADYWNGQPGKSGTRALVEASAVAGLRWRAAEIWFVDASFGPHVLSETHIGDKGFGVALQLGSKLAAGAAFGEASRYELGVYVEHLSNASLAQPNNGVTFFGLEYRCALH